MANIEAILYRQDGSIVKNGGPWNCEDHHGVIENISKETDLTLVLLGRNSSNEITYRGRSEEHTSELQSHSELVCRLLLEKKKKKIIKKKKNKKKKTKKITSHIL